MNASAVDADPVVPTLDGAIPDRKAWRRDQNARAGEDTASSALEAGAVVSRPI